MSNDHIWNQCTRKIRYPTRTLARRSAKALSKKNKDYIEEYYCSHCDGWHVGHPIRKRYNV